jgi:hemerythrin-like domain-containing protein
MLLKIGNRPDHGFDEPLGLLSDCHRRIEQFLRVLRAVTDAAGGGTLGDTDRAQLQAAIAYFAQAAPRHTADEEESLFPRLRASADPVATRALDLLVRLEQDHAVADERHQAVDRLVREHLDALHRAYETHIAIEDQELFPAAARVLSREQVIEIGREMAARRG